MLQIHLLLSSYSLSGYNGFLLLLEWNLKSLLHTIRPTWNIPISYPALSLWSSLWPSSHCLHWPCSSLPWGLQKNTALLPKTPCHTTLDTHTHLSVLKHKHCFLRESVVDRILKISFPYHKDFHALVTQSNSNPHTAVKELCRGN